MAHWHDFNPWAHELVYLPTLEEAARVCTREGDTIRLTDGNVVPHDVAFKVKHWLDQSIRYDTPGKLDAYLLCDGPLSIRWAGPREFHCGVRWGREREQYFSPMVQDEALAKALFLKYGGTL